jgi:hypothetical protein
MTSRILRFIAVLVGGLCAAALAGEIVILQPAQPDPHNRNDRNSDYVRGQARQQAGKGGAGGMTTIVVGDEAIQKRDRNQENSQDLADDAASYLRPPQAGAAPDGTVIILRAAPPTANERLQQKARSYVVQGGRECASNVGSSIGTIGEGPGAQRGNVLEKGTSNVDAQGQCRK